mmetsp:Transcript_1527/g.3586  ORF Transcript_1527/g.3586 Transcript_1527/m.3586 type:complete len:211 (+) Transcript_1527:952-1584(+)
MPLHGSAPGNLERAAGVPAAARTARSKRGGARHAGPVCPAHWVRARAAGVCRVAGCQPAGRCARAQPTLRDAHADCVQAWAPRGGQVALCARCPAGRGGPERKHRPPAGVPEGLAGAHPVAGRARLQHQPRQPLPQHAPVDVRHQRPPQLHRVAGAARRAAGGPQPVQQHALPGVRHLRPPRLPRVVPSQRLRVRRARRVQQHGSAPCRR